MDDTTFLLGGSGWRRLAGCGAAGMALCLSAGGAFAQADRVAPPSKKPAAKKVAPAVNLSGNDAARQREAKNLQRLGLNLNWRKATLAELKQTEADLIAVGDDKDARLRIIAAARLREYRVRVAWRALTSQQLMDRLLAALDVAMRETMQAQRIAPATPLPVTSEIQTDTAETQPLPPAPVDESAPAAIYVPPASLPTTVYVNQPYPVYVEPTYSSPSTIFVTPPVSIAPYCPPASHHSGKPSHSFTPKPIENRPSPPLGGGASGNFGGGSSRPRTTFQSEANGYGLNRNDTPSAPRPVTPRPFAHDNNNTVRQPASSFTFRAPDRSPTVVPAQIGRTPTFTPAPQRVVTPTPAPVVVRAAPTPAPAPKPAATPTPLNLPKRP